MVWATYSSLHSPSNKPGLPRREAALPGSGGGHHDHHHEGYCCRHAEHRLSSVVATIVICACAHARVCVCHCCGISAVCKSPTRHHIHHHRDGLNMVGAAGLCNMPAEVAGGAVMYWVRPLGGRGRCRRAAQCLSMKIVVAVSVAPEKQEWQLSVHCSSLQWDHLLLSRNQCVATRQLLQASRARAGSEVGHAEATRVFVCSDPHDGCMFVTDMSCFWLRNWPFIAAALEMTENDLLTYTLSVMTKLWHTCTCSSGACCKAHMGTWIA